MTLWWPRSSPQEEPEPARRNAEREDREQPGAGGAPATAAFDVDTAVATLVEAGWEGPAARAVAELNAPYLSIVAEASPQQCEDKIRHLARLGDHRHAYARRRIETLPEIAGLLSATIDGRPDGPDLVAAALGHDSHTQALVSLFAFSATGEEAVALADVITRDRDLAVRLAEPGDASLLSWLIPKDLGDDQASEAYQWWARRIIADAVVADGPDAVDEAFTILAMHGEQVARVLREDAGFRAALPSTTYPVFQRLLQSLPDDGFSREAYLLCPQIWEFIHRHPRDAENLLAKVGTVAVDAVMDPRFAGCQEGLIDVLSFADQGVVDGLLDERVRGNPRFPAFLTRLLPPDARVAALQRLSRAPESAGRQLAQWEAMTNDGVVADVGPPAKGPATWLPGYSAAVLMTKIAQGREVTGGDLFFAALDGVEAAFLVRGSGATLKAIGAAVRESAVRRVGNAVAEKAVREATEASAKKGARALAPWSFKAGRQAAKTMLSQLRQVAFVDVTPVVRGLYKRSGLNANTFRIIGRLDPRIFMRRDRRVVVDLAGDHPLGRFLTGTAANAGLEKGLGNEVAVDAGRAAYVESATAIDAARRNIAAWWLAAADGTLERLAATAPAAVVP